MKCVLNDVVDVKVLDGYKLHLLFDDGLQGDVDISQLIEFKGVFRPLKNKDFFSRVAVNSDIGTICWENGADISPSFLRNSLQARKKN